MLKKEYSRIMLGFCLIVVSAIFVLGPAFAADTVIELTVNDHNPAVSTVAKAWDYWGKWVEDKSGGRLKMTIHHGGALLKGNEAYRGVQKGIVDIAHYVIDRKDGFELNTVTALPFMGLPAQTKAGYMYLELLGMFPEMQAEWKDVKIIGEMMMPPSHIHTVKKIVKAPQDLKGMKIFTPEAAVSESVAAMGATPLHIDIADMYMSVDRGLVDGLMLHFPVMFVFGVLELTPYHTVFGDGGINMTPMFNIMNTDKFNSLPPDLQKIIVESGPVWADKQLELDAGLQKVALDKCKGLDQTFTYLTPEQIAEWRTLVKGPVHDKWIKQAESQGLPGKAVYEETLQLIKKYNQ